MTNCGSGFGGHSLSGVNLAREAVIQGRLLRSGEPVGTGYVRLLDAGGEFVAEVPTGPDGGFRFFAGDGRWTLRALAPKAEPLNETVEAAIGTITEVDLHLA